MIFADWHPVKKSQPQKAIKQLFGEPSIQTKQKNSSNTYNHLTQFSIRTTDLLYDWKIWYTWTNYL